MLKKIIADIIAKRLRNKIAKQTLSENDVNEILNEIKVTLIEADVNVNVTREFLNKIRQKFTGMTLSPGVDIHKYLLTEIKNELIQVLDNGDTELNLNANPACIMLVGLQGSGKTTTVAKIANYLKNTANKKPLIVGIDVYRPAAIDQLKKLADEIDVDFFDKGLQNPIVTAEEAIEFAKNNKNNVVILDTAGRLQTDEQLMNELVEIKRKTNPQEILLVVDALTGQEMANIAREFNQRLNLTGALITKLDSNARAGAILSITSEIKKPIKFIGNGEKINMLEKFHPNRIAGRILGLGDVLTLAEKAADVVDEETVMKSFQKMLSGKMDLNDLMLQIDSMRKVGNLNSIMSMMPNIPGISSDKIEETEERISIWKVLISSMTLEEKKNPKLVIRDAGRRMRIVKGSGRKIDELNKLLKNWETSKKKLEQMGNMLRMGNNPFGDLF